MNLSLSKFYSQPVLLSDPSWIVVCPPDNSHFACCMIFSHNSFLSKQFTEGRTHLRNSVISSLTSNALQHKKSQKAEHSWCVCEQFHNYSKSIFFQHTNIKQPQEHYLDCGIPKDKKHLYTLVNSLSFPYYILVTRQLVHLLFSYLPLLAICM